MGSAIFPGMQTRQRDPALPLAAPTASRSASQAGAQFGKAPLSVRVADLSFIEALFDTLADVVYFAKDREGRYLVINNSLARRCGRADKRDLIGKTARDIFPHPLGDTYLAQDLAIIGSGQPIQNHLELHLYANRRPGWCLTDKMPLLDAAGRTVGMTGISRDLGLPDEGHPEHSQIASIAQHIRRHYAEPVSLAALAQQAGLSIARVERYFQRIFRLTPRQMLLQARLDAARSLLASDVSLSIVKIALACGYSDHSAFTRQFKATVGMTPMQYRALTAAQTNKQGVRPATIS
jgi:AraC-like DNA-binding protein